MRKIVETRSLLSYTIKDTTVKPPKRGHFGTVAFVLSSEVVLLSEVAPFLLLNPIQCV